MLSACSYFYKSVDDAELDARPPIRFERYWPEQAIELRTAFWESSVLSLPPYVPTENECECLNDCYPCRVERINVHALAMEDVPGKAFVDFANSASLSASAASDLPQSLYTLDASSPPSRKRRCCSRAALRRSSACSSSASCETRRWSSSEMLGATRPTLAILIVYAGLSSFFFLFPSCCNW